MNDETKGKLGDLLHIAGETHHSVFRIEDGDDPDWATWYADWLVNHTELPELLGTTPVRSELTSELVALGKEYAETKPDEPWEEYYATRLMTRFGKGNAG